MSLCLREHSRHKATYKWEKFLLEGKCLLIALFIGSSLLVYCICWIGMATTIPLAKRAWMAELRRGHSPQPLPQLSPVATAIAAGERDNLVWLLLHQVATRPPSTPLQHAMAVLLQHRNADHFVSMHNKYPDLDAALSELEHAGLRVSTISKVSPTHLRAKVRYPLTAIPCLLALLAVSALTCVWMYQEHSSITLAFFSLAAIFTLLFIPCFLIHKLVKKALVPPYSAPVVALPGVATGAGITFGPRMQHQFPVGSKLDSDYLAAIHGRAYVATVAPDFAAAHDWVFGELRAADSRK